MGPRLVYLQSHTLSTMLGSWGGRDNSVFCPSKAARMWSTYTNDFKLKKKKKETSRTLSVHIDVKYRDVYVNA